MNLNHHLTYYLISIPAGPYVLGAGVITFLLSKEIWIVEHGFTEFVAFWGAIIVLAKKLGPKIAASLDKMSDVSYWYPLYGRFEACSTSNIRKVFNKLGHLLATTVLRCFMKKKDSLSSNKMCQGVESNILHFAIR